jgi:hypothetical protein
MLLFVTHSVPVAVHTLVAALQIHCRRCHDAGDIQVPGPSIHGVASDAASDFDSPTGLGWGLALRLRDRRDVLSQQST